MPVPTWWQGLSLALWCLGRPEKCRCGREIFARPACGLTPVCARARGPAQSHPLAQREVRHPFGVKDRCDPLRFLRFLLLILVPAVRAKAKRFTEGNEGNEELAPGLEMKVAAPFVSFVSFCYFESRQIPSAVSGSSVALLSFPARELKQSFIRVLSVVRGSLPPFWNQSPSVSSVVSLAASSLPNALGALGRAAVHLRVIRFFAK